MFLLIYCVDMLCVAILLCCVTLLCVLLLLYLGVSSVSTEELTVDVIEEILEHLV